MPRPAAAKGSRPVRRAASVTLPETLLLDARTLGIDVSQACERGLENAVIEQRSARWMEQNREAIDAWNKHVAEHGLPLAAYRQF